VLPGRSNRRFLSVERFPEVRLGGVVQPFRHHRREP
jgi:hypothetical protein